MKEKNYEGEFYTTQIEFSKSGNASCIINEKEVFINKKNTLNSLHLDKVRVTTFKSQKGIEARVVEVVERFKTQYVGKVQVGKKSVFVVPDSPKIVVDFYIKGGLKAEHDQKVLVELTKWEDTKSPQGKIVKILGSSGDNNTEMNSIMYEYGLPVDFPQDVINESELISEVIFEKEIKKRKDFRFITTFTIDPVDAKDFDDALSVEIVDKDRIRVGVHIADVSHYVKVGSNLDKEAYKRATSVYLVDRCVPMLPERLSNGICSLKPNEDRLAFSVVFTLDLGGNILDTWFGKTIIHSDRRFTYEEAQEIIEGESGDFETEIRLLDSIARKIRKKRIESGSIEMGGIEVRFNLDEDKKPTGVYFKHQKEANKLIEEFMLLANKSVAKYLSDSNWFNIYRVHDTPNVTKLSELQQVAKNFGHQLLINSQQDELKKSINDLLRDIKETPEENMIETLVTRCMSKATYTIKNIGHYGLGFGYYSHFTSPIRRYPDLITHRILQHKLNGDKQGNPTKIEEQAKWCSQRELIASRAERDSIKYKQAEFLLERIGQVFDGIVSGVTDWGIYVELVESKCEGLIRFQSIGSVKTDLQNFTITDGLGNKIRLGDPIRVSVKSVDLERKQIDFIPI
jgi:ribonuclease R